MSSVGPLAYSNTSGAFGVSSAAESGEPIALTDLDRAPEQPLRDVAVNAGFHSVLVVPLVDQQGTLGALVVLVGPSLLVLHGEPVRLLWDRTLGYQAGRDAPFMPWGYYDWLEPVRGVVGDLGE